MAGEQSKKKPNPTDVHVGSRIRLRRNLLGMSQERLGEKLGITFQQVQKYEKGANRVGASRLQAIATVLGVPVSFFFEEMPAGGAGTAQPDPLDMPAASAIDFCTSPEGQLLAGAFMRVRDTKVRRCIIDLVRALATDEPG